MFLIMIQRFLISLAYLLRDYFSSYSQNGDLKGALMPLYFLPSSDYLLLFSGRVSDLHVLSQFSILFLYQALCSAFLLCRCSFRSHVQSCGGFYHA